MIYEILCFLFTIISTGISIIYDIICNFVLIIIALSALGFALFINFLILFCILIIPISIFLFLISLFFKNKTVN
jgi:hypothetical protein